LVVQGLPARLNLEGEHAACALVAADRAPRKASWRGKAVETTLRGERAAKIVLTPGGGVLELIDAYRRQAFRSHKGGDGVPSPSVQDLEAAPSASWTSNSSL
jgi:hypothetical protein